MALSPTLRPDRDVVDTELDDGNLALLHLGTKRYFSLNVTATVIWRGLQSGLSPDLIAARLQQRFSVAADQAQRSVERLTTELIQQGLLTTE